ncbi:MAG: hypothetical protein HQL71_12980 [Magnetococcales bacterium]|nr:hypothetical protein [Magnetococcales bacterium]
MNMLLGKLRLIFSKKSWFSTIVFLFLISGCSPQDTSHIDPKIFANDTTWQSIQHYFTPESYWQEKVKQFSAKTNITREHFFIESKKYRDMLTVRRNEVAKSNKEAKKRGEDPKAARHKIIKSHREALDPQRALTRELGKKLRKEMALLDQVRHEYFKSKE